MARHQTSALLRGRERGQRRPEHLTERRAKPPIVELRRASKVYPGGHVAAPSVIGHGAIVGNNEVFTNVAEIVIPEDFAHPGHSQIFAAMRALMVNNVRYENIVVPDSAVLGEVEGLGLALLVDEVPSRPLVLDWSARGDIRPGGTYFSMRVPPCALQSFEIELPLDQALHVASGAGLLTGPRPAESAERRLWRVECGGKSQVDLVVRRVPGPDEPPLVVTRLQTEQILAPHFLETAFAVHLEVLRGALREIRCLSDPGFEPHRVSAGDHEVSGWELIRAPGSGGHKELVIRLQEPLLSPESITLSIRGICVPALSNSPIPQGGKETPWTAPWLKVQNAVPRGETIQLRVPPELQLAAWESGGFSPGQFVKENEGRDVLTLHGTGGEGPVRPRAQLRVLQPEVRVWQQTWWNVTAAEQSVEALLSYLITQGRLYRLSLRLPAWSVESVEMHASAGAKELNTPDLVRTWTVIPDDGQSSALVVDLHRGLDASTAAQLRVRLRQGYQGREGVPSSLPFPEITPPEARAHDGVYAVTVEPSFEARPAISWQPLDPETPLADPLRRPNGEPLWGTRLPDFLFAHSSGRAEGALELRPRGARVKAHCRTEVRWNGKSPHVFAEIHLQPAAGNPPSVDLRLSAPAAISPRWETLAGGNSVRRLESAGSGPEKTWRLILAQPLREALTIRLDWSAAAKPPLWPLFAKAPLPAATPPAATSLAAYLATLPLLQIGADLRRVGDPVADDTGSGTVSRRSLGATRGGSFPGRRFFGSH